VRGGHAQSVETTRGGAWQHHKERGFESPVDRQFFILDSRFSSSYGWRKRRVERSDRIVR
jgi:hypothetical protein